MFKKKQIAILLAVVSSFVVAPNVFSFSPLIFDKVTLISNMYEGDGKAEIVEFKPAILVMGPIRSGSNLRQATMGAISLKASLTLFSLMDPSEITDQAIYSLQTKPIQLKGVYDPSKKATIFYGKNFSYSGCFKDILNGKETCMDPNPNSSMVIVIPDHGLMTVDLKPDPGFFFTYIFSSNRNSVTPTNTSLNNILIPLNSSPIPQSTPTPMPSLK